MSAGSEAGPEVPPAVGERAPARGVFEHLVALLPLVGVLGIHLLMAVVIPQFDDIFTGFEFEDLPALTRLFLTPMTLLVLPALAVIAWGAWLLRAPGALGVLLGLVVASGLMLPLMWRAMYLPIFLMGATVAS